MEGDTDKYKSYEVEKVIAKRMLPKKGKRAARTEYLIKWKGYDDQWNQWMAQDQLDHAQDLVQEYEAKMKGEAEPHGTAKQ
jgi:cephalosporin-C deacetylase-like acetyl esterase